MAATVDVAGGSRATCSPDLQNAIAYERDSHGR